jgi:hypothetical protein
VVRRASFFGVLGVGMLGWKGTDKRTRAMYLVAARFVSVSGAAKAALASRREDSWMNMFVAVHGADGRENEMFEG